MNIYVGNLSYNASEEDIRNACSAYGQVASVTIVKDKFSGESRGFAFVEMPSNDEGDAAIAGLNGADLKGRALKVNQARPKENTGGGGGRPDGGGGRGGFRSGDRGRR
jgi:RNA recognition motif-containing protein